MLLHEISKILTRREFISVATCNFQGEPNAAPKFFLKIENNIIYLIDYAIGKTWENLKINPKASLSVSDPATLKSYKINGKAEIIETGAEYDQIAEELTEKELKLSVDRIIEGVLQKKKHENFPVGTSNKFVIFRIIIQQITEIGHCGKLHREEI